MGKVSFLLFFFLERDPNTFFYRPKNIVIQLGDWLWVVKWLGNGPKTRIPLQFFVFHTFCEYMRAIMVQQACVRGQ
jgi:hypothetical protein